MISDPNQVSRLFQVFFDYVKVMVDIPESDQIHCRKLFKPFLIKKGTVLETEGTLHRYHNFIVSGHMRNYQHDAEGQEITTDINNGPGFFTSYNHFINQTISNDNLHCITDCELLRISREDVETASKIGLTSKEYTVKALQYYLESSKQRAIDLSTLTGKQRYLKLLHSRPSIIQHVPLTYISSYLGLNAGSLSRIRQEIS